MVKSVMPLSVAQELMIRDDEGGGKNFRPFIMTRFDVVNTSIATTWT